MSAAGGRSDHLSNLLERKTTPDSRNNDFSLFFVQGAERLGQTLFINDALSRWFEPSLTQISRGRFVFSLTLLGSRGTDRAIAHNTVQPSHGVVEWLSAPYQFQERLLNAVFRDVRPLRRE